MRLTRALRRAVPLMAVPTPAGSRHLRMLGRSARILAWANIPFLVLLAAVTVSSLDRMDGAAALFLLMLALPLLLIVVLASRTLVLLVDASPATLRTAGLTAALALVWGLLIVADMAVPVVRRAAHPFQLVFAMLYGLDIAMGAILGYHATRPALALELRWRSRLVPWFDPAMVGASWTCTRCAMAFFAPKGWTFTRCPPCVAVERALG